MKKYIAITLSFIVTCLLCGCISKQPVILDVKYGERANLSFTGKGAAAGMMIDSVMAGMGVAIGIAIDEGIAKDISANLNRKTGGFDMVTLVKTELTEKRFVWIAKDAPSIVIETYGFRTSAGQGDKVTAWLKMKVMKKDQEETITYPDDFMANNTDKLVAAIELVDAKTNPELTYKTLDDAVQVVLSRAFSIKKKL